MTTASIGEHGIIGNMRSAALVNVFGAIDFFCFPEFDSPSVFASLLDSERAGSFSIRPAGEPRKGRQIYLPETNVLTTRFISQNSILELCDWMPVGGEALPHCIIRLLTATHGDIEVELRCRPAFQYAGVEHTLELSAESAAFHAASTGLPSIRLRSSVGLRAEGGAAFASFRLKEGESAYFILGDAQDEPVNELIPFVRGELQRTCAYWKQWAGKSVYEGRWRESVTRSALTLKLLTSAEHGSLVAAPTFGLPELIGGGRNWDYRYTWIRDASFTLYAFYRLGYLEEGRQFFRWLKDRINLRNLCRSPRPSSFLNKL
jgi:GH15 family glucan-1,4-alpha-glucosidase